MAWNYYHDQDEKARVQRDIERRRKRGEFFEALAAPAGNSKLVKAFWALSWCKHLESHSDYEHRLPRGRSYLRQGNVYNLAIEPGKVTAIVAGSELYEVCVTFEPLTAEAWNALKADCAGKVASLLDLLSGRLGDGVLRAISDPDRGLFPKPREIRLSCTCPDHADMCKHVAAVLYGVGVQLETKPELFFDLRSVDPAELLSTTASDTLAQAQGADAALAGEDLSALFGIDLGQGGVTTGAPRKVRKAKTDATKPKAAKKPARPKTKRKM
jgi:uncharacterized Zn finger protein